MVTGKSLCDYDHNPRWKSARFAPTFQFGTADFPAPSGIVVAALLLFGLGNHGRDLQVLAGAVDGYERQVGGGYVLGRVGNVILNEDLHTHFHRAVEDAINRGAKDDKISDADRDQEIDVIDGGGDDVVTGMTVRGHGAGEIDPVHQASAEQGGERVGVVGQNDFGHLGLRIANRTR